MRNDAAILVVFYLQKKQPFLFGKKHRRYIVDLIEVANSFVFLEF